MNFFQTIVKESEFHICSVCITIAASPPFQLGISDDFLQKQKPTKANKRIVQKQLPYAVGGFVVFWLL